MDHRFNNHFYKYMAPLQAQVDALLAEKKTDRDAEQAAIDLLTRSQLNKCFLAAGLVIGSGDAAKIKIANTVTFINQGLFKSKTTAETVFGATAATTVPVSSFTKYLVTLNASGTPKVTEGNNAVSAVLALLPAVPANETPIGYCQVETDGTGTFVPDTDDLSDAAVTDTYVDLPWPDSGVDALVALGAYADALSALGVLPRYK